MGVFLGHSVTLPSGICLSVWRVAPHATTLLFYPSTMASPLFHEYFLRTLWRMGFNVVAIHPVGHGDSRKRGSILDSFVFDDIVCNGLEAAAWARENFTGPLVVTGHSQGGILTLAHALHDPHIQAAVPICTLLPHHPLAIMVTRFHDCMAHRTMLLKAVRWVAAIMPRFPVIIPFYLEYDRLVAGAKNPVSHLRHLRWHYPLRFVSSLFHYDMSDACIPGRVRCPVWLMVARNDALFSPSLMQTMLDAVHAPEKRLILLSGGGHMAPLCAHFAHETAARLAELCAGHGLPLHQCRRHEGLNISHGI